MKVLVTRVGKAAVGVGGECVAAISRGLVLFVGIAQSDDERILSQMAKKVLELRIFEDEREKMNYSLLDQSYEILCISNFTLCARTRKGRRPSFDDAMELEKAKGLFEQFVDFLSSRGLSVKTGIFGKHMDIDLSLDGPVNIILESNQP